MSVLNEGLNTNKLFKEKKVLELDFKRAPVTAPVSNYVCRRLDFLETDGVLGSTKSKAMRQCSRASLRLFLLQNQAARVTQQKGFFMQRDAELSGRLPAPL